MLRYALPAAILAASGGLAAAQDTPQATARITGADGAEHGSVALTEGPNGVVVQARLSGLPEGGHGFHVHETGDCGNDFQAAGGHANPTDAEHGFMTEAGPHLGDMPNIYVDPDGWAQADALVPEATLTSEGETQLLDDDGAAILIHEAPDDYVSGDSAGGRIACGVIESAN